MIRALAHLLRPSQVTFTANLGVSRDSAIRAGVTAAEITGLEVVVKFGKEDLLCVPSGNPPFCDET